MKKQEKKKGSTYKLPKSHVVHRIQLTLHAARRIPHGASRLVQATSAWSVKTRHALSWRRQFARVYGHTTTAMYDNEYPPAPTCSYIYMIYM